MLTILKKILSKLTFRSTHHDDEYAGCINDLINHEEVKSLENYVQHKNITRLHHSISVSYHSFKVCKFFGWDHLSAARGGLLHDFYLYGWEDEDRPSKRMHGFLHPKIALENATKHFQLNKREKDIIRKHMWPMTISLPKCKEAWVVVAVDKYCAIMELFNVQTKVTDDEFLARVDG